MVQKRLLSLSRLAVPLLPKPVNKAGLEETRKRPGWHDEPLLGERKGQRSIRLNKQWRAIYIIKSNGTIEFVEVTEVMPHEY